MVGHGKLLVMRPPRSYQLSPWADVQSSSHRVISRVVDRQFVRLMRMSEEFYGVRVLTYCVMTNHFHLMVEVPSKPKRRYSVYPNAPKQAPVTQKGASESLRWFNLKPKPKPKPKLNLLFS